MVKVNLLQVCRLNILTKVILAITLFSSIVNPPAHSNTKASPIKVEEEDKFTCPADLKKLTTLLLTDLPAYSNRVIQRTQNSNQSAGIENYIIAASEAEFEPLGLPRLQYSRIDNQDPKQVFFTVSERQYIDNKIVDIQSYHWLFLTQIDSGWSTVMMFSRFGNSTENSPPTPPKETTNGIIGRGVQLWLKDCRAGTVRT